MRCESQHSLSHRARRFPRRIGAQFKQRYKQYQKTGLKVDVVTDDNGYWNIALWFQGNCLQFFLLRLGNHSYLLTIEE
jgi:hypothetical protein